MMSISDICKDSIGYPFKNTKFLGLLAIIFIISALLEFLLASSGMYRVVEYFSPSYAASIYGGWQGSEPVEIIISIIGLIIALIILGYKYRLMESSINSKGSFPEFDNIKLLFKQGIKMALAAIVYLIIPVVLIGVSILLMDNMLGAVANQVGMILLPIAIIIFVIAACVLELAFANMVKYNTFKYAFKIHEIFEVIKSVGYLRIIGAIIFAWILMFIIGLAVLLVGMMLSLALFGITSMLMISVIALVIFNALLSTYDLVFYSRFYSLVYKKGKGI